MRALILTAFVALLALPALSLAAGDGTANTTTTAIITSQGSGQNGTSSIIIDNSRAGNGSLLGGLDERTGIQQRINDLIASAANDTGGMVADMQLSGNIASAQFNLDSGQVEQTYFGTWSLEVHGVGNASFSADFEGNGVHYTVGNVSLNSVQIINEHVALGGTANVTDSQGRSWEGVPVSIVVIDGRGLAVTFGDPELDNLFGGQPLYGVVS